MKKYFNWKHIFERLVDLLIIAVIVAALIFIIHWSYQNSKKAYERHIQEGQVIVRVGGGL